ncbi:MAG TPA: hypothetical protein VGX71_07635 [Pseudaminobacter sp.]|nr:hypothetical protein [Pseudaminobacter sp.]
MTSVVETYRQRWVDFIQIPTPYRRAGCTGSELALVCAKELIDYAFDPTPKGVDVTFADRALVVRDRGVSRSEEQVQHQLVCQPDLTRGHAVVAAAAEIEARRAP